jgi:hypothetical protein
MLYPLSYEGLPVHLPSVWAVFGPLGSGWIPRVRRPVPHLCRVPCGLPLPAVPTRGADCTDGDAGSSLQGRERARGIARAWPAWQLGRRSMGSGPC